MTAYGVITPQYVKFMRERKFPGNINITFLELVFYNDIYHQCDITEYDNWMQNHRTDNRGDGTMIRDRFKLEDEK